MGRALVREVRLAGWGVIRPCRKGHKIGPLVADDRPAAEILFAALTAPSQRLGCSGSRRSSLDKRGTRAAFLIQIPYSAPLPPARKLRGNAARLSEKTSAAAILPQLSQFRPKVWRPFA